jgi:hypothetical protein
METQVSEVDPYGMPSSSYKLPTYMLADPAKAPFKVTLTPDPVDGTVALESRANVFSFRAVARPQHGDDPKYLEMVVDDMTRDVKGAIIDHYGLLGELDLRARQENSETLRRLQRMIHGGARLDEIREVVDFVVDHNNLLDYPWKR